MTRNPVADLYFDYKRPDFLNTTYLSSYKYEKLFHTFAGDKQRFLNFINDAEEETRNFRYRHQIVNRLLGAWRWKPLFMNRDRIIPIIFDPNKAGIDFGGGAGPVNPEATIVDFNQKDVFGRMVKFKTLADVDFQVDYIFSSHTLEHIKDLDGISIQILNTLKKDGYLILNLPSYTCLRWRSGIHSHKAFNDHQWTFTLSRTEIKDEIPHLLEIDTLLEKYFKIELKEYSGDNSIFLIARRLN